VGEEAKRVFNDAKILLTKIIDEGLLEARAVVGFYPANSTATDDIRVWGIDDDTNREIGTFYGIRQQAETSEPSPSMCLSDFIAPESAGYRDYIGLFAVTAGIGEVALAKSYESDGDDYNSIMVKALADRLAEALAEELHEKVRSHYWGYAMAETLSASDMHAIKYEGIRPAPGYPSQPDHTEKRTLWQLLNVEEETEIELTESLAMNPPASVCGLYFANPKSKYFAVGKITKEQVEDYAARKGMSLSEAERWLAPCLSYA
jgi:5-methyltetrahydrofolate--homocysteine methyltransferase